jgi:hypothetical protein
MTSRIVSWPVLFSADLESLSLIRPGLAYRATMNSDYIKSIWR